MPGCPDYGVRAAPRICLSQNWDIVECLSWANAATNLDVLSAIRPGTRLVFTPHCQPMWTLGDLQHSYFMVMLVFRRMLERSDAIFINSPNELDDLGLSESARKHAIHIPLGVDTATFYYTEGPVARRVFCVADFREPRKRMDLLFDSFGEVARQDSEVTLMLAGNHSKNFPIPPGIAGRVTQLGYVTTEELVRQYRQCGVFALLSDYEAFGLPIAEALCCGAPAIINGQPQLAAIFGKLPGLRLVHNRDASSVARAILSALNEPQDRLAIAHAATKHFALAATWGRKLRHVLSLLHC